MFSEKATKSPLPFAGKQSLGTAGLDPMQYFTTLGPGRGAFVSKSCGREKRRSLLAWRIPTGTTLEIVCNLGHGKESEVAPKRDPRSSAPSKSIFCSRFPPGLRRDGSSQHVSLRPNTHCQSPFSEQITKLCFARQEGFNNKNYQNSRFSPPKTTAHIVHRGKVDFY